jgi:hypothetical protein
LGIHQYTSDLTWVSSPLDLTTQWQFWNPSSINSSGTLSHSSRLLAVKQVQCVTPFAAGCGNGRVLHALEHIQRRIHLIYLPLARFFDQADLTRVVGCLWHWNISRGIGCGSQRARYRKGDRHFGTGTAGHRPLRGAHRDLAESAVVLLAVRGKLGFWILLLKIR